MPAFPSGTIKVWAEGTWTSQTLDVSMKEGSVKRWNELRWVEFNANDETKAYVRVDILNSNDDSLQTDLVGTADSVTGEDFIVLSDYANVVNVDIKIKFKIYGYGGSTPLVRNMHVR